MTPPTLSRVLFAPAYQELVLLAAALVESTKTPAPTKTAKEPSKDPKDAAAPPEKTSSRFRRRDSSSDELRQTISRLKEQAAESLVSPQKEWCTEAEDVIDWSFEIVMRVCFSESWLPPGSLLKKELKDEYHDRLMELGSGRTRKGSPPQGLVDLYLGCLPIIYHSDEAGAQALRNKVRRSKDLPRTLTLPRPQHRPPSVVQPLLGWRWVTLFVVFGLSMSWLTYSLAWHRTEVELLGALPDLGREPIQVAPATAPPAPPVAHH